MDAVDRMVGNSADYPKKIEFRIESVELGSANQSIDRGGAHAALIGTGKEIVFTS